MVFQGHYADAYDALYTDKDYRKECDYLEALFAKYQCRPRTVLDLGCGTGGHAVLLAQRGYAVTGVDRSSAMLDIARRKANEQNLSIELVEGDITRFSSDRQFDAVIAMFAVMGYQTTNAAFAATCSAVRRALVPGGIFLFDCWNGNAVLADRPAPRLKEIDLGNGNRIIRFTLPEIDETNHVVKVNFKVWKTMGKEFTETAETHLMRYLFPQETRYFLETAGFNTVDLFPFLRTDTTLTAKDWNMMVIGK